MAEKLNLRNRDVICVSKVPEQEATFLVQVRGAGGGVLWGHLRVRVHV